MKELHYKAILGPFDNMPISLHTSPLMVRDKHDSDSKRTIVDLSWSDGNSVNDGILNDMYLDTEYLLKYQSVYRITTTLKQLGPAAMINKIDISRAFRQIKTDCTITSSNHVVVTCIKVSHIYDIYFLLIQMQLVFVTTYSY